jgi:polysaccharide deacetylase 2 family uncharacterized protein YibQ
MPMMALKERLEPHISVRAFALTLGGLLGATFIATGILALTSGGHTIDASVTIPLSGNATIEDMTGQMTARSLNAGDMELDEPGLPPSSTPVKKERPPIEDAIAGLHENTPFGLVPVVRKSDGLTAFKAYKAEFSAAENTKAIISLVMVDYGLSKAASEKAISALPHGITFALSPYSQDAQKMTTTARQQGHEVWLTLPIQNASYGNSDSGNQTILVNASVDQNKARLLSNLGKATGYVGVIDLDSPAFNNAAADLDSIYSNITTRGLALAQGNPKDTLTGEFATMNKSPFIQNDVWIDAVLTREAVDAEIKKLTQLALNGGTAVGFFRPYPAVIAAIHDWRMTFAAEQIELAPLSAAIEQKKSY